MKTEIAELLRWKKGSELVIFIFEEGECWDDMNVIQKGIVDFKKYEEAKGMIRDGK